MRDISIARFPAASLALAMVIAGTVGAFVTESGQHPVTVVFWRCVFGSLFLAAWCLLRGYLPDRTLSPSRLALAALGGACMVLSWTAFFAGFGMTSIATTTIVYHVQPFFVVLIGVVFLKERISLDQLLWMLGAFVGVALAAGLVATHGHADAKWALGIALTLGAALLYAVATILAKGLGQQRAEITVLCQTLVGIVLLAPFADIGHPIAPASWGWLAGIGVLHTGIAYVLMNSAFPRLTTPVIGILTFIYPVVAIIIDWALYGHPLGPAQAAGMALIALATLGVRLGWRFPMRRVSAA
ncbi:MULTISPECIES: DMT family transporter [unclassified Mesorhizobium]|uniref:DMT family transporter n=1 Tax=unclassified Mesorhizobium TaxID=325217 RepID=UPI000FD71F3F|nr:MULTISPECIES: DMT family transporter [unclassified Mesorhizobium]TGQ16578.1 DMT family transporter [Mesorhizobium sp. M2E.F.Ca.ET.219.01.1.1]TGT77326.1 DMT family transporter [Mesorhizobium sp. M2E.F.Ca.ET.166.01.1.1]TGW03434.1 DMT family transporter [Mesorhizobium sp. M2E.F.Ca.ET.154.01.1.1]